MAQNKYSILYKYVTEERINNFVYSIEIYITKIVLSTPFTYSWIQNPTYCNARGSRLLNAYYTFTLALKTCEFVTKI